MYNHYITHKEKINQLYQKKNVIIVKNSIRSSPDQDLADQPKLRTSNRYIHHDKQ